MIYTFVGKIEDIRDNRIFSTGRVDETVAEIGKRVGTLLEIEIPPPDVEPVKEIFLTADISVSSAPKYHEVELEEAITAFKAYLEEFEHVLIGKINKTAAFYNNSKEFSRLYNSYDI